MLLKRFWCCTFLALPLSLPAGDPPVDLSRADVDGPHVFYRGQNIVVKSVERRDTSAVARTQVYTGKMLPMLTCRIPELGDEFSFKLRAEHKVERDRYDMPSRLLALSDIEGDFKAFKTMLFSAKVIDEDFNWTFGSGHLVLLGDFFDRGLNVTECLWLIYKLETEAEAAGGKVHFILGNHEIMNLQGYTDYVRKKYFENSVLIGEDYKYWFDNQSELGRWLRTKNAVEKIGNYIFCHGGISPELVATRLSIADINRLGRQYLDKPLEQIKDSLAKAVFDLKTGIFWYRTAAKNMLAAEDMTKVLKYFGAAKMVVGHTLQPDIMTYYDGGLICIDLYHEENMRRGFMKTLWVEDGISYALDSRGEKSSLVKVQHRAARGNTPVSAAGN